MEAVVLFGNVETIMVDVRTEEEFFDETLEGAISIPLNEMHISINKIISGSQITNDGYVCKKDYIVFCDTGKRSLEAFTIFKKHGFKVFNGGALLKP